MDNEHQQTQACVLLPISQHSGGEQPDIWMCLQGLQCPSSEGNLICSSRPSSTSVLISSELDELGAMLVLRSASKSVGATGCELHADMRTVTVGMDSK